jgi:cyclophilin family peptidyl-prolyl cis-trans isomerase
MNLPTPIRILVAGIMASALFLNAQDTKPAAAPKADDTPKPLKGTVKVSIETSKGTIELDLDADKAPISVANFVAYAKKGHYEGTIFHRCIPTFMIQGGGFSKDGTQKPTDAPIENESQNGLKNVRGSIAMARTRVANSATCQFFINVKDNDNLDYPSFDGVGYAVFGKVTKGMDVVDAIKDVPTRDNGMGEKSAPLDPPVIKKVTVME